MSPEPEKRQPTPAEIEALKHLAAGIIRAQGNRFVKDLLRSKDIRIGGNKDEFQANLTAAIESGELTLEDVRTGSPENLEAALVCDLANVIDGLQKCVVHLSL
jgi:hypothetical protein